MSIGKIIFTIIFAPVYIILGAIFTLMKNYMK